MPKAILKGIVQKISSDKTISVHVNKSKSHPLYRKIVSYSKKYLVHDGESSCKVGDSISIIECKPFSKMKRWKVLYDKSEV